MRRPLRTLNTSFSYLPSSYIHVSLQLDVPVVHLCRLQHTRASSGRRADVINNLRGGGEIWRANMRHFRLCCAQRDSATQESDGGCEGSDAEMIGNGRRGGGAGERDRDLEEDEDEGREERSSESGGGGGFGGWRTHLLGGLTQRVKSWYWGARPLVSFPIQRAAINSLFLSLSFFIYLSLSISVSVSHTHAHFFS